MDWKNNPPFGIGDEYALTEKFLAHCNKQLAYLFLKPVLSKQRILDIFCAWKEDLNRSKGGSFRNDNVSPDHIKAAAHLTYWIRRGAPLVDLESIVGGIGMYSEIETAAIELELDVQDLNGYTKLNADDEQKIKNLSVNNV